MYDRNGKPKLRTLFFLLPCIAFGSLLCFGIDGFQRDHIVQFQSLAKAVVRELDNSLRDYENAGLWMHEVCRHENITRTSLREAYEHLKAEGLQFQAVECIPNVTDAERTDLEAETGTWYADNYPEFKYHGFKGYEPIDPNDPNSAQEVQSRSRQDFYFPVRYVEPFEGNEAGDRYQEVPRKREVVPRQTKQSPSTRDSQRGTVEITKGLFLALGLMKLHRNEPCSWHVSALRVHTEEEDISSQLMKQKRRAGSHGSSVQC